MNTVQIESVEPLVFTSKNAGKYIGLESGNDVLRIARSTGLLWGHTAPKHIKASKNKILYRKSELDKFIAGLEVA